MRTAQRILAVGLWLLPAPGVSAQLPATTSAASAASSATPSTGAPTSATGKTPPVTAYAEKGLFHGGYWSREEQPGHWIVNARVYGTESPSRAFLIALYRAAELTRDAGYAEFRVVGQVLKTTFVHYTTANYLAIINVVAVGSPAAGQPCLMKNTHACVDLPIDRAFDLAGPGIGMPTSRDMARAAPAPVPAPSDASAALATPPARN